MARVPLLGGAYQARSLLAAAQKCINLYPENNPEPASQAPVQTTHYPTPGLRFLGRPSDQPGTPDPIPTPPFTALGVDVDGSTLVTAASLTAADSGKLSYVIWWQTPAPDGNVHFATDPEGGDTSFSSDGDAGGGFISYGAFTQTPDVASKYQIATVGGVLLPLVWHVAMVSMDTNQPIGSRAGQLWVDDTDLLDPASTGDFGAAFTIATNGLPYFVGGDTFENFVGSLAEHIRWCGVQIDWSVEANRRLLLSSGGLPVDPTAAFTTFGDPAVYLSRRAGDAPDAFATNRGTGGAFTVSTGALTGSATPPSL